VAADAFSETVFGLGAGTFTAGPNSTLISRAQAVGPVARHLQVDRRVVADVLERFEVQSGHRQPFDDGLDRLLDLDVVL